MSDLFLSYASADREKARLVAQALSARGHSVWWDRAIPPGQVFDEVIQEALASARCAIVLWSKASVKSNWVKTEAAEAESRDVLVPAIIENVAPPLEFRRIQAANLVDWNGDPEHGEFKHLLASVDALLAGGQRPSPKPPPSSFASSSRSGVRSIFAALAAILVIGAGWIIYQQVGADKPVQQDAAKPPAAAVGSTANAKADVVRNEVAEPVAPPDSGKARNRINLLSKENGGEILVAASGAWLNLIDGNEDTYAYVAAGEGVFGFKDEKPATFDMFTVLIRETSDSNLNEFELLTGNDSPTGRFESAGKFKTQNVRLFKTPHQEFAFPSRRAKYLKVRSLTNHRGEKGGAIAYEFQLFGKLE